MFKKLKKKYQKQLNRFHNFYFGIDQLKKKTEESKPKVKPISDEEKFPIGSIWEFRDKNPFKRFDVQIKELREGHILYRHCISSIMCQKESCSISFFIHMYRKKNINEIEKKYQEDF